MPGLTVPVKTQQKVSEVVRTRVTPFLDVVYLETPVSQAGIGSFDEHTRVLREGVIVVFPVGLDNSLEFLDYPQLGTLRNSKAKPGRAVEGSAEGGMVESVTGTEGMKGK